MQPFLKSPGAGERGEIAPRAKAPSLADGVKRLMTAEVLIDGVSQGPLVEGVATVRG